ncbi:MAG: hypothetical protein JXR64_12780 [Spirochaetales bacterium]|nr:hypothetical protein [Spirochaetales bacterium]
MKIETIKQRKEILQTIRNFYDTLEYLEVETPLISPTLIPESNIEIFETTHIHPFKADKKGYLIPSPEVWLKQFISQNHINVYEISKCFRNSEQSGKHHNPEFSMIEYYTMGFSHLDTLNLTIQLLEYINSKLPYSKLSKKSEILSMNQAFINYAGFSLEDNYTIDKLHKRAVELGISISDDDDWETAFNRIFLDKVEPNLPNNVNLFLTDFPSNIKTLAKKIPNTPWAERWELYINGIECGNCYSEERDPQVVKDFFNEESEMKEKSRIQHKVDSNYYTIFKDFPKCSGGAIGLDRLIMGILGIDEIEGVILFPYRDNI